MSGLQGPVSLHIVPSGLACIEFYNDVVIVRWHEIISLTWQVVKNKLWQWVQLQITFIYTHLRRFTFFWLIHHSSVATQLLSFVHPRGKEGNCGGFVVHLLHACATSVSSSISHIDNHNITEILGKKMLYTTGVVRTSLLSLLWFWPYTMFIWHQTYRDNHTPNKSVITHLRRGCH